MSAQHSQHAQPTPTMDERIAQLDAALATAAPRAPEPPPVAASDEDSDVVQAMQQLLIKHEDTQLHKVEDPELIKVLNELRALSFSNIADVFETRSVLEYIGVDEHEKDVFQEVRRLTVKDIHTLPREVSAAIQSIKVTAKADGDVIEVKLYDKQVSLDKLMRFHGAYVKDNEQLTNEHAGDQIFDLLLSSISGHGMPVIENNNA